MRIGMTDFRRSNPDQNIGRTNIRNWNVRFLKRLSNVCQLYGFH